MRNFLYKLTTATYNLGLQPRECVPPNENTLVVDVVGFYTLTVTELTPLLIRLDAVSVRGSSTTVLINAGIARSELQTILYHSVFRPLDRLDSLLKPEEELC